MATGDGLLVRLRLTGGILSFKNAHAIAACADRYGNGLIDLSSRGNLQLRGVSNETLQDLISELENLKLLDSTAEAEAVRNVVASPLAGIDPDAALDIGPVVQALEATLTENPVLHRLPGKFGFLIDDGGHISLSRIDADIRFEAFKTAEGPRFTIRLGGANDQSIGESASDELANCAVRLAEAFLALRGDTADAPRRMRDVVKRTGVAAVAKAAGFELRHFSARPASDFNITRVVGHHYVGAMHYVGVAMPFGRLSGADLADLASLAERHRAIGLRLTPWRAIIVADVSAQGAQSIITELAPSRFILDADDPRLSIAACPGAPACRSATTPVQQDAERLAGLLQQRGRREILLHVSGCAKGCAHSSQAPFTLVGNGGLYDLVENGTARDSPTLTGLPETEVRSELAQHLERYLKERVFAKLS
jgi:precorrin-3B synthase